MASYLSANNLTKIKKVYFTTLSYFKSSLKSASTLILITFNAFLLISLYLEGMDREQVILSYLIQAMIVVLFFGIAVLSLRQFISTNKKTSGKGVRASTLGFVVFVFLFYGMALSILFIPIIPILDQVTLGLNFAIGLSILFIQKLMFLFINIKKERQRLENTDLAKSFFEPAGNIFPIYIAITLMVFIEQTILIIVFKTFADIIINSPMNAKNPYVYKILSELKRKA